jgi:hypothetical protein
MRTKVASGLLVSALALTLSGCGLFDGGEEREPWRVQAEARCVAEKGVVASAFAEPMKEIEGPNTCGIDRPFKISGLSGGTVTIQPAARLNCPQAAAMTRWTDAVVTPAAHAHFGMPVVAMKNAASYGCRTRNHKRGGKLSEHSFGNALDISAFILADGREISLIKGWRGTAAEQAFLREVTGGACGIFRTVLGPGSDGKHEDHLHLDLARHDAQFQRTYCRPKPGPKPAPSFVSPEVPMVQAPPVMDPQQGFGNDPYAMSAPMSYAPQLRRPGGKPTLRPAFSAQSSIEDLIDE